MTSQATHKRVRRNGVYLDRSTKGANQGQHHAFRAEVRVDGRRIRKRFATYAEAHHWMMTYEAQD